MRINEPNLLPVGYLIVEATALQIQPGGQTYQGVDRLPHFVPPEPEIREYFREPLVKDKRLYRALDEWFATRDGPIAFIPSAKQALRLFDTFVSYGYGLELLFCHLAWQPGEEGRVAAYRPVAEVPTSFAITYGFDVSWPAATHSAIYQPGVVPENPGWLKRLNEWGLLSTYEDAKQLREEYLAVYPYPPFDIYLVHKVR
jgi:hypothetical protein